MNFAHDHGDARLRSPHDGLEVERQDLVTVIDSNVIIRSLKIYRILCKLNLRLLSS